NLAHTVWQTLDFYGLLNKLSAVVADNATNNDTLLYELEDMFREIGVQFSAKDARLRCTPHTIHLSAMKLLDGIGAIPPLSEESRATPDNYQESVAEPTSPD
ncbi:hypothetical protein BDQ12DRAFT_560533, partial [Crucibulum laeve]